MTKKLRKKMSKRNNSNVVEYDSEGSDVSSEPEPSSKKQKVNKKAADNKSSYYVHEEDLDDGYDSDLMGDSKDKAYINSLPELEKEEVIYQRYTNRQELQRKKEILRKEGKLIEKGQKEPSAKQKTHASLADMKQKRQQQQSSKSKPVQTPTEKEHDLSLDEEEDQTSKSKIRQRSKKKQDSDADYSDESDSEKRQTRSRSRSENKQTTEDEMFGSEDEEDDDDDYQTKYESSRCHIEKQDLEQILIRRSGLEQEYKKPYFSSSVQKAFVRVLVGNLSSLPNRSSARHGQGLHVRTK